MSVWIASRKPQHNCSPLLLACIDNNKVGPPDKHGFCSLGTSVDVSCAACEVAPLIVAEVCNYCLF